MALNVTLMVCWIVLLAQRARWTAMTVGILAFTLILAGLSAWLILTLKEIGLNNRQANFVDSVTHELKSPIAALQLYLETLRMRNLDSAKREEFHAIMAQELQRLDQLINQLLEVSRLDAIGENTEPEDVFLPELLRNVAEATCGARNLQFEDVFTIEGAPLTLHARQIVLELIFSNLLSNAVKYGGDPPEVKVELIPYGAHRARVRITNNGYGVPHEDRKKVFQLFYRGGNELQRRRTGTGLGLYIVSTLVRRLNGRVSVSDRADGETGATFEVELPGLVPTMTAMQPRIESERGVAAGGAASAKEAGQ